MKILHIHPAMRGGGIEAMICGLANEMSLTNDVTVCSIYEPLSDDVFWNKLSTNVHKISFGKQSTKFSIKEVFDIYRHIKENKYDVVHIHGMFYYYMLSCLLLHNNTHFFYTIHSDAVRENSKWDKRFLPIKRFCFSKKYIHPITISKISQDSFWDLYHCDSTLIYNGIEKPEIALDNVLDNYRLTNNTKLFIHAGRIDTPKNQVVLCRVFQRLIDEGHDVVLLIAGVKQRNRIFDMIEPYLGARICYLGERKDIPKIMANCEAMCLPSIWEGLPVTLIEALAVGCIPICSPVGGIPDVVENGVNGMLSLSSSEEDYYNTMKSFLSLNNEALQVLRENCINSFPKYDIRLTAQRYLTTYQKVIEN